MKKPTIAMVGAGALAQAIAVLLKAEGYQITSVQSLGGRSAKKLAERVGAEFLEASAAPKADLLWLLVPDAAIAKCARQLAKAGAKAKIALHSSGALPSSVLAVLAAKGMKTASAHPMMSFVAGDAPSLAGVFWALEGEAEAVAAARRIARSLDSETFEIKAKDKPRYHAFGALLSPMLVSELTAAEAVGSAAGIPRDKLRRVMRPIVERTLANYFARGGAESFSGPLRRGDVETVREHLNALHKLPLALEAYRALSKNAVETLPGKKKAAMRRVLGS